MNRLAGAGVPLLVAVLLGLAALTAAFSTIDLREAERELVLAPATRAPDEAEPDAPSVPPPVAAEDQERAGLPWIGDALLVILLAAALAGLVLLVRALLRRRGRGPRSSARRYQPEPAPEPDDQEAPLVAALDAGLGELSDDDRDPRRAVIACWVRLEQAATAAGVPRYETDTATDLVVRLLRARQISEPVLASFAEVYRLARYATRTVDEQMRTHARTALARLREQLLVPTISEPVP